jgi:hypothetical protein
MYFFFFEKIAFSLKHAVVVKREQVILSVHGVLYYSDVQIQMIDIDKNGLMQIVLCQMPHQVIQLVQMIIKLIIVRQF